MWLANRGQFASHYCNKWIAKRHGRRLLEAPRPRLKRVQRVILRRVLDQAPLHPAAMGFRLGRSVLTHARTHAGKRWVVSMDLCDFFAAVSTARVAGVFRSIGLDRGLASVLADLTTTKAELAGGCSRDERLLYGRRHLPQGAPTSPALANRVAIGLDHRLAALASHIDGAYSRYADDIVISCDALHHAALRHWLVPTVGAIAIEEGFVVRFRKTRVMSPGARQMVTGLTVNCHPTVPRDKRKRLEAILHNCVKHGPASQDRQGRGPRFADHLRGSIAHVTHVDARHGRKLLKLFEQIAWPEHDD